MVQNAMIPKFDKCKYFSLSYINSNIRLHCHWYQLCIYVVFFQRENLFILSSYRLLCSRVILVSEWHANKEISESSKILFCMNIVAREREKKKSENVRLVACFMFPDYPILLSNQQWTCKRFAQKKNLMHLP